MCRHNIRALPYVHFHGNESQFDTQQQHHREYGLSYNYDLIFGGEERLYIWIRGDGDDALCPKVAEVKFEPHLHFILKIDPPTNFCVWM